MKLNCKIFFLRRKILFSCIAFALFSATYFSFFPRLILVAEIEPDKIPFSYYLLNGSEYSEAHHFSLTGKDWIQTKDHIFTGYTLQIPNNKRLRIDAGPESGKVKISLISKNFFYQKFSTLKFTADNIISAHDAKLVDEGDLIQFDPSDDSWVDLNLQNLQERVGSVVYQDIFLFFLLFIYLMVYSIQGWVLWVKDSPPIAHLSILILFIFLLLQTLGTKIHIGPDEPMHLASASWYGLFTLPPFLASTHHYIDEIWKCSYVFGVGSDLSYLISAKMKEILSLFGFNDGFLTLRTSQLLMVFLFLGLIGFFTELMYLNVFLLLLMIVPQFSFIQTYFNGDALSFSFSYLGIALILTSPRNSRSIFLRSFIALFLLFASKLNMLALAPAYLYFYLRLFDFKLNKQFFAITSLLALSLPIFLYRRIFNIIDQFNERTTYLNVIWERFANVETDGLLPMSVAKRSFELRLPGSKHWNYDFITENHWYLSSFKSFFGTFGLMNVNLPSFLTTTSFILLMLFFLQRSRRYEKFDWILAVLCFILAIAASLYYSVSHGYQPQGRYLFSILIIVGALVAKQGKSLPTFWWYSIIMTLVAFAYFARSQFYIDHLLSRY